MSSISCWTSATRCSNSSVSHPTSNSYPSTFSWSIHRWRDFSPLSILSAAPSRLAFDQGSGRSVCVFWVLGVAKLGYLGRDFNRARRRHFEVDVTARTDEPRAGNRLRSFHFPQFVYPYTLSLAYSVWAFYLTCTSPTRHAPRRSRDFPRHTASQASNDVQCHVGEGHPGNVQKVHGQCM